MKFECPILSIPSNNESLSGTQSLPVNDLLISGESRNQCPAVEVGLNFFSAFYVWEPSCPHIGNFSTISIEFEVRMSTQSRQHVRIQDAL